jgi:SAM-dependent methyltransferase
MTHTDWSFNDYLDFFFYNIARRALLFGINNKPIIDALRLKPQESIIDIGCGWGEYAKISIPENIYTGIDNNPKALAYASKKYRGKNKVFLPLDITELKNINKSYDKALLLGVLHHLPKDIMENHLFPFLKSNIKSTIVICDPVYLKNQFLSNLLGRLDKGKYVMSYEDEKALLTDNFKIKSASIFSSNSRIAKYGLFTVING